MILISYPFQSFPCQSEILFLPVALKGNQMLYHKCKEKNKITFSNHFNFHIGPLRIIREVLQENFCHGNDQKEKRIASHLWEAAWGPLSRGWVPPTQSRSWVSERGSYLMQPCEKAGDFLLLSYEGIMSTFWLGCLLVSYGTFSWRTPASAAGNLSRGSSSFANSLRCQAESLILCRGRNGVGEKAPAQKWKETRKLILHYHWILP